MLAAVGAGMAATLLEAPGVGLDHSPVGVAGALPCGWVSKMAWSRNKQWPILRNMNVGFLRTHTFIRLCGGAMSTLCLRLPSTSYGQALEREVTIGWWS